MTSSEEKYMFYDCHVEYLTIQNVSSSHCGHIVCLQHKVVSDTVAWNVFGML